jgi:membrane protease YdiL (CAAX protease family)
MEQADPVRISGMATRAGRIAIFFVPTLLLTHVATTLYRLAGGSWNSLDAYLFANVMMLIPGVVALVVTRVVFRTPVRAKLGLFWCPNRWWLVAWLLPPALMLATLGVSLLMPGASYAPDLSGAGVRLGLSPEDVGRLRAQARVLPLEPLWAFLAQGLVLGPTLSTIGGLGEELGWRGVLYDDTRGLGFWRCTLVTAALWAAWHIPVVLQGYGYPQHPVSGALVFSVYIILFAPLFTYFRIKCRSVFGPAVLHGSGAATGLLTVVLVKGGTDLTTGWGSVACLIVLAVANLALIGFDRWLSGERLMSS